VESASLSSKTKVLADNVFYRLVPYRFNGRIGRLRYLAWLATLLLIAIPASGLLLWLLYLATTYVSGFLVKHYQDFIYYIAIYDHIAYCLFLLLCFLIGLTVLVFILFFSAKRLHDIGFSGWFSLILLLPGFNFVLLTALLIMQGNPQCNSYGSPPPLNSPMVYWLAALYLVPLPFIVIGLLSSLLH